jgi:hypothetical protein
MPDSSTPTVNAANFLRLACSQIAPEQVVTLLAFEFSRRKIQSEKIYGKNNSAAMNLETLSEKLFEIVPINSELSPK